MASATERVVVLMTPEDKAALERKAAGLGVSVAELVRRSTAAYDADADIGQIRELLAIFNETHAQTLAALDGAERELRETLDYFAARRRDAA